MVVRVPLDKMVLAYVRNQLGSGPVVINTRSSISMVLFEFFRPRNNSDTNVPCGKYYLEVKLPALFITQGKTYIGIKEIRAFETIMRTRCEEHLIEMVYQCKYRNRIKYKEAVLYAHRNLGLDEEILPYQTLWKRVQRHRQRLENRK